MPKVSIIIPSFNHAEYVGRAIQSALNQTFDDFELIIIDDGSTDDSHAVINRYADPRIHAILNSRNVGAAAVTQMGLERASGQYFCLLNSDDIFSADKLEKQVTFMARHPAIAATFSDVEYINEYDEFLGEKDNPLVGIFKAENMDQFAWLNYFFHNGNSLCHPTVMARTACLREIGGYELNSCQLADFSAWIRLCTKYPIHVSPEKLIRYRVFEDGSNASGVSIGTRLACFFEYVEVLEHFKSITSPKVFTQVFPNLKNQVAQEADLEFILALYSTTLESQVHQCFGLNTLNSVFADEVRAKLIRDKHGFYYPELFALKKSLNIYGVGLKETKDELEVLKGKLDYAQEKLSRYEKHPAVRIAKTLKNSLKNPAFF